MPKSTSVFQSRAHESAREWCGTRKSEPGLIADVESRLEGMQEAIDGQFQRIIDLQMRVERVEQKKRG